nr:uncharacterized protein LOC108012199 [Drosophila suzukii]
MIPLIIVLLVTLSTADLKRIADKSQCPKTCDLNYKPVCASRIGGNSPSTCTFPNHCTLKLYLCNSRLDWSMDSNQPCQWPVGSCEEIANFLRNKKDLLVGKSKKVVTENKKKKKN